MWQWLWMNKDWIFQGSGIPVAAKIWSLIFTAMLPAVVRAYRRWRAGQVLQHSRSGARERWGLAGLLALSAIFVAAAWMGPQPSAKSSATAPGGRQVLHPEQRASGSADTIPLLWVTITREGTPVCEGRTDLDGVLTCDLPAGVYDVSSSVSGVPIRSRLQVEENSRVVGVKVGRGPLQLLQRLE